MIHLALRTDYERTLVLKDADKKPTVEQMNRTPFMVMMREVDKEIIRIQEEVEKIMKPCGDMEIIFAIQEVWLRLSKWIGERISECYGASEATEGGNRLLEETSEIKAQVWAIIRNALFQDWVDKYPGLSCAQPPLPQTQTDRSSYACSR